MPAKAERTDPGAPLEPYSPITVPVKRTDPPREDASADTPPKMAAVSEALPWASMNAKDAVKRSPPFWDRNTGLKTPLAVPASRAADLKPASSPAPKPKLAAVPARNAESNRPAPRDFVSKQFLAERKQELQAAGSEFRHAVAELCANARHAYADWEFRKNLRQTRERAQASLAKTLARKQSVEATPENNSPSKMQVRIAVARNVAIRIQNKAAASFANSAHSAGGLMHRRIRIRIAAGPQLRSYADRFQQAQARSRSMLQQNSRLATSLAMAALSALLTLGLILIIGHYQPSANAEAPAVTSTPQQGVSAIPTNRLVAKPSPVSSAHSGSLANSAPVVNTTLREPANHRPATTKLARRPHHNEDEDYVAPDTYVYYGKRR